MSETVQGLGRCEALPDHIATLTPAVEGHVHELFIKHGDSVKKGQPIVRARRDGCPSRPGRENSDSGRTQGVAGSSQIATPSRGAEVAAELAVEQARVAVERAQAVVDGTKSLRGDNLASKQQFFDAEKALEAGPVPAADGRGYSCTR